MIALLALARVAWAAGAENEPLLRLDPGGHTAIVKQVMFTPDGRYLVSAGEDKTVRFWDTATGEPEFALYGQVGPGAEGMLFAAAVSRDGKLLAAGGYPNGGGKLGVPITLFNVATRQVSRLLKGHEDVITGLAFSPDGSTLASASLDRTIRLWSAGRLEGGAPRVLAGHAKKVAAVAFSPDGKQLASAGWDGTVRVWDVAAGTAVKALSGHGAEVNGVAWSPDGKHVASASWDKTVRVWDAASGATLLTLTHPDRVWSLAYSPDGRSLVTSGGGGGDRVVRVWSLADGKVQREFGLHSQMVPTVAWSPDGASIASAGGNANEIYLWNPATAAVRHRLAGTGSDVLSVAWSPDSKRFAWGNTNGAILAEPLECAFDLEEGAPLPSLPNVAWQRAAQRRGNRELARTKDRINVVVLEGEREVATFRQNPTLDTDAVHCFTFTPGGEIVVGSRYTLALYDAAGKRLREFVGHLGDVWAVAVSPDGRWLASASLDQTVRIWPLAAPAGSAPPQVEPLLSVFRGSDLEWIAWTPAGFYACSPGAERAVGWQVNRGVDRAADFYPAFQFRRRFYRPDVIAALGKAGSLAEALRAADAERKEPTDTKVVADKIEEFAPPRIEILSPADGAVVTEAQVSVRFRVVDPNQLAIRSIGLNRNGRKVETRDLVQVPNPATNERVQTAVLTPGENVLTAVAVNDAGAESLPTGVRVHFRAAEADIEKPALYVLSIGVSKYQQPQFSLKLAAKDATDFAAACQRQEGKLFRKVTAKTLTDAGAGKGDILDGLDWLSKQVTQRDWAIVFVSGHGVSDNLNQYHFAPHDIDPERLKRTGIVWTDFRTTLANLPGKVFMVLDTCHAGGASGLRTRGGDPYTDVLRDAATDEVGLITFASCMPRELSEERDEWNNGAFTKSLIEALDGKADANRDGTVTLAETDAYVAERVKELTDGRQHPTTQRPASIRSSLPFAIVR